MKKIFLGLIFLLIGIHPIYASQEWSGKVVGVADGDTITVLAGNETMRVRLAEIDAPEKHQAFGTKSKQSLSDMVFGKNVKVIQTDIDRYGRIVGRVYAGDLDVNAEQIQRGMAWVYRKYSTDSSLLDLENDSKINKKGLWIEKNPVPPWEFRRGNKSSASKVQLKTESQNNSQFRFLIKVFANMA